MQENSFSLVLRVAPQFPAQGCGPPRAGGVEEEFIRLPGVVIAGPNDPVARADMKALSLRVRGSAGLPLEAEPLKGGLPVTCSAEGGGNPMCEIPISHSRSSNRGTHLRRGVSPEAMYASSTSGGASPLRSRSVKRHRASSSSAYPSRQTSVRCSYRAPRGPWPLPRGAVRPLLRNWSRSMLARRSGWGGRNSPS